MAKANTKATEPKAKTIKVSTLIISVAVLLGLVASFVGGIYAANNYHSTVKAQAVELSKEFEAEKSKTEER